MSKKTKRDNKLKEISSKVATQSQQIYDSNEFFFSLNNIKKNVGKIGIILGGAVLIFILTQLGILEKIKPLTLSYFYDYIYVRYSPGSLDIGIVLLGLWLVVGLSLIHPVLGISLICFLRCWLDGYTYPTDNTYFTWGILITGLIFIIHSYSRRSVIEHSLPAIMLIAFVIVAGLTLPFSYQVGRSYRVLILWISYCILLITTYNLSMNTHASKIIIWSLLITLGLQTWYAFLHFHYVLPFLRKSLMLDPSLRIKFFGTAELSKELIYRFNMNRAFGTMLFPNGLAGFIILVTPLCFSKFIDELSQFWSTIKVKKTQLEKSGERKVLFITGCVWLFSVILIFITQLFPLTYEFETQNDLDFIIAGAISILLALLPAGLFAWVCIARGYEAGKSLIKSIILMLCFFFAISSLWLTYSRGAWISLGLSFAMLFLMKMLVLSRKQIFIKLASFFILVSILISLFMFGIAQAQSISKTGSRNDIGEDYSKEVLPSTQILEEGVEVTWKHLRDPSSFRLRWSYWKVGVSMFFHNFLTGVGLGNFGLAYPKYQYLGAGDVKECHNGYLQMLCETGIAGGGLFLIFVLLTIVIVFRNFINNVSFEKLSISIGILAFLIHAGIDIHFSHPSLVTYFVLLLGILLSKDKEERCDENNIEVFHKKGKIIFGIFIFVLFSTGIAAFPPYFRDLVRSKMSFINVGKDYELQVIMKTVNFVFSDVLDFALGKNNKEPKVSGTILRYLFVDLNRVRSYGKVYVPKKDGSNKAVLLPENEPVPEDCILLVKEPWKFIWTMKRRFQRYGKMLEKIDKIFPLQDDMPNYLGEFYKTIYIHLSYAHEPDFTNEIRDRMLYWCREVLRRNPYHGDSYYNYGKALWYAGVKDDCPSEEKKKEYLLESLRWLEKSAEFWKNVPFYWYDYVAHIKDAKKIFSKMGEEQIVAELEEKEIKFSKYADELVEKRRKLGI